MNLNNERQCPWGKWEVLCEDPKYKVKRITVDPGKRLSYQTHSKRREYWMIVSGSARVTLNGTVILRDASSTVDIPLGAPHRIENPGVQPLVFIEIQTGTYFGEDDIVRLEDDFGRAN
jgi:mannose-6-phosphate isomerase-like protein (cupin superfamily)